MLIEDRQGNLDVYGRVDQVILVLQRLLFQDVHGEAAGLSVPVMPTSPSFACKLIGESSVRT